MKTSSVVFLFLAVGCAGFSQAESCDEAIAATVMTQCKVCHSVEAGKPHLTGPNLFGLYGRKSGSVDGFAFSYALRSADISWDDKTLNDFLANPQQYLPRNRMAFGGVTNPQDRAAIICSLKNLR